MRLTHKTLLTNINDNIQELSSSFGTLVIVILINCLFSFADMMYSRYSDYKQNNELTILLKEYNQRQERQDFYERQQLILFNEYNQKFNTIIKNQDRILARDEIK